MTITRTLVLLVCIIPQLSIAEPLGRLFFTTEQRIMLDNARRQKIAVKIEEGTPVPQLVTVNGIIKRSDGRATIWVNNKPISDSHSASGLTVVQTPGSQGSVTLQLPQSTNTVKLKVGQNLDVTSGEVSEPFDKRVLGSPPLPDEKTPANKPVTAETLPTGRAITTER